MAAKTTALAGWKQASAKQAPLLAAGVAFYTFLSLFPALIAAVLGYGIVADPATVARQSQRITDALPADAASLVTGQMDELVSTPSASLGWGVAIALVLALYSASGGVGNLVTAINYVFGYEEKRNFIKKKLLALGLTLGAIVFLAVTITLVAVAPAVLDAVVDVPGLRYGLEALRWVLLLGAVLLAVAVLFRVAPDRPNGRKPRLISRGVAVATLLWVLVSVGFSLYVDNFGSYGKTYGALAGVVVLLLWLWIGLYALLLGAAIEAVREDAPLEESAEEVVDEAEHDPHDERSERLA